MAWNGKHPLESASRSLLENFEFFAYACLWVQYPIECGASSRLNHCKRFSHYWASLAEEERKRKKEEDWRFGRLANYRLGTPVMISINANSLVVDENTREWLVWLIKASDYIQSRVLNIRFCTRLMGPPFFFWVIPTYRVLPYSMIFTYITLYLTAGMLHILVEEYCLEVSYACDLWPVLSKAV